MGGPYAKSTRYSDSNGGEGAKLNLGLTSCTVQNANGNDTNTGTATMKSENLVPNQDGAVLPMVEFIESRTDTMHDS